MSAKPVYRRILLKLSGESLAGTAGFGINAEVLCQYASEIKSAVELGVQLAVVVGGGNIFRGISRSSPALGGFGRIVCSGAEVSWFSELRIFGR